MQPCTHDDCKDYDKAITQNCIDCDGNSGYEPKPEGANAPELSPAVSGCDRLENNTKRTFTINFTDDELMSLLASIEDHLHNQAEKYKGMAASHAFSKPAEEQFHFIFKTRAELMHRIKDEYEKQSAEINHKLMFG